MDCYIRRIDHGIFDKSVKTCDSWCVIRQLPTLQSIVVGRFSSRIEAENHHRFVKRLYPDSFFEVMFDAPL